MWSKVVVGSNEFLNHGGVPGILIVDGEKQIILERGTSDQLLLLSIDLYDEHGDRLGKLRRNAWPPAHDPQQFVVTSNPASLTLLDRATGEVIVEARVEGPNELVIPRGRFFTRFGDLVEITPEYWVVGGFTLGGNRFSNCAHGVTIDRNGGSLG